MIGVEEKSTIAVVAPAPGWIEALSEAVGETGQVLVAPTPEEGEVPKNVTVSDALSEAAAPTVIVWLSAVPVHSVRDLASHVAEGGALWTVLPRAGRGNLATRSEGDVKRSLLAAGWRSDRTVAVSNDEYAVRFHKRR